MHKRDSTNHSFITLFALIFAGEAIFFLPFILPRIFRPTLLAVFEISNTELGSYYPFYGVIAMISYFFGGPLADRFPARNLMSFALWLTAIGGLFMITIPGGTSMKFLYGFWGLTTILLFWAALIRATREWGGENYQGRAFGWLESGRGITAAFLGTIALFVFSAKTNIPTDQGVAADRILAFRFVIGIASLLTIISGLLVWFFVPKKSILSTGDEINIRQVLKVASNPSIRMLSIIVICAYVGYKITDDFSLYAHEVLALNEVKSTGVGTGALWMRALVAFTVGFLADRFLASRIILFGFALSVIGGLLIASGLVEHSLLLAFLNLMLLMTGIYSIRALYFALIDEARIPLMYTGTAVGLVCLIGFTPDIFMSPWMGYLLDRNPGPTGHHHVFIVLAGFAAMGFVVTLVLRKVLHHKSNPVS